MRIRKSYENLRGTASDKGDGNFIQVGGVLPVVSLYGEYYWDDGIDGKGILHQFYPGRTENLSGMILNVSFPMVVLIVDGLYVIDGFGPQSPNAYFPCPRGDGGIPLKWNWVEPSPFEYKNGCDNPHCDSATCPLGGRWRCNRPYVLKFRKVRKTM